MGCSDKSTKYLKALGYNVVKHPRSGIVPLELIGRQSNATMRLGTLDHLIRSSNRTLPGIVQNELASDINGQVSSSLNVGVGVNILGNILSAFGAGLGVGVSYTNAKRIRFLYTDVLSDRAIPLEVGTYLRRGDLDAENLILKEYVLGTGELFLIVQTVKAAKFSVTYEAEDGIAAKVDVPAIEQLVGGNVKVEASGASSNTVTFEGPEPLTFAFKCLRVGVEDGDLRLLLSRAGNTALEALGEPRGLLLTEEHDDLLELLDAPQQSRPAGSPAS